MLVWGESSASSIWKIECDDQPAQHFSDIFRGEGCLRQRVGYRYAAEEGFMVSEEVERSRHTEVTGFENVKLYLRGTKRAPASFQVRCCRMIRFYSTDKHKELT